MGNLEFCAEILTQLYHHGVREYAVCPGARNAPLIKALGASQNKIKTYFFFDERAAGFFALGRARQTQSPVAVVSTSGTAVANLLPSCVEAHYTQSPVVYLTADRPRNFRGSASPQTIDQTRIFSHHSQFMDVAVEDGIENTKTEMLNHLVKLNEGPVHLNVCLDEPLLSGKLLGITDVLKSQNLKPIPIGKKTRPNPDGIGSWGLFQAKVKRPVCILSSLTLEGARNVELFLEKTNWPVYAESTSQLQNSALLKNQLLRSGTGFLENQIQQGAFDGVIRIGGIPTTRLWRDLESKYSKLPVIGFHEYNNGKWTGLARETQGVFSLDVLFDSNPQEAATQIEMMQKDQLASEKVAELIRKCAGSEPSMLFSWAQNLPERSHVFLGNSLPIREWDLIGNYLENKNVVVSCNRGANGIDGLVATFLGQCYPDRDNFLILGDLSALYDLNSFAMFHHFPQMKKHVLIVNNGGGKIFAPMFQDSNFEHRHEWEFSGMAKMFNLSYRVVAPTGLNPVFYGDMTEDVIELKPNESETEKFQKNYKEIIL
jgi:2-succinyl-5-enolpyruvyl-6-hydroxy-3-cyclohexene-1-carboxylate synthase